MTNPSNLGFLRFLFTVKAGLALRFFLPPTSSADSVDEPDLFPLLFRLRNSNASFLTASSADAVEAPVSLSSSYRAASPPIGSGVSSAGRNVPSSSSTSSSLISISVLKTSRRSTSSQTKLASSSSAVASDEESTSSGDSSILVLGKLVTN
uniref:(northern house mosquito) hypothetical protein n=1 Tax=Culex pipiens TaxID=7175 RepID=A0A8D8A9Q3_CULPI